MHETFEILKPFLKEKGIKIRAYTAAYSSVCKRCGKDMDEEAVHEHHDRYAGAITVDVLFKCPCGWTTRVREVNPPRPYGVRYRGDAGQRGRIYVDDSIVTICPEGSLGDAPAMKFDLYKPDSLERIAGFIKWPMF